MACEVLLSKLWALAFRWFAITGVFFFAGNAVFAQTCNVINSIPATPPASGYPDILVFTKGLADYEVRGTRIYDTFDINGNGNFIDIPATNTFWSNVNLPVNGPLQRTGVWSQDNPLTLGFSVCVEAPEDKSYYIGLAGDNSATLKVDGTALFTVIDFSYWRIYKIPFTKGKHLVELSVLNFGGPATLGLEIYDNTESQIIKAQSYGDLNLVFSTSTKAGLPVEEGDPASSYSCPVGFIPDFCEGDKPVCSQFVPISLIINNPAPACSTPFVNITDPQITAGSPSSLTYTYWKDNMATVPLDKPDSITQSGTYYIMGSANGCSLIKPVTVLVNSVSSTINKTICPGETYMGHTKTGIYHDTLKTANGCDNFTTLNLTVTPGANLGADREICPGDTVLLTPGTFAQYLWQDNTTKPFYVVRAPGTYWVTVTDQNGCYSSDTVVVKYGGCFDGKIPNTFTPNGDGINDTWVIGGLQKFSNCSVFVYNRWGEEVYESIGYAEPWDGNHNGKPLPVGTYYYVIDLKNNTPPLSGFVTIIR